MVVVITVVISQLHCICSVQREVNKSPHKYSQHECIIIQTNNTKNNYSNKEQANGGNKYHHPDRISNQFIYVVCVCVSFLLCSAFMWSCTQQFLRRSRESEAWNQYSYNIAISSLCLCPRKVCVSVARLCCTRYSIICHSTDWATHSKRTASPSFGTWRLDWTKKMKLQIFVNKSFITQCESKL